jgi:hypothetical protein
MIGSCQAAKAVYAVIPHPAHACARRQASPSTTRWLEGCCEQDVKSLHPVHALHGPEASTGKSFQLEDLQVVEPQLFTVNTKDQDLSPFLNLPIAASCCSTAHRNARNRSAGQRIVHPKCTRNATCCNVFLRREHKLTISRPTWA